MNEKKYKNSLNLKRQIELKPIEDKSCYFLFTFFQANIQSFV